MNVGYVATARRVKNCPLGFRAGERMALPLPAVGREDSDRLCALAIADIIPVIYRMEKVGDAKKAAEMGREIACTGCQAQKAFVEFELVRSTGTADSKVVVDGAMLDALKEFAIFAPLPSRVLTRIAPIVKERDLADHEIVVERNARGERLYLVASGEVVVLTTDVNGVETDIATLPKGEVFGEMSLLTGEPASATIRSRGATRLLTIEKADFDRLVSGNPGVSMYFTKLLAERLKKTSRRFLEEIEKGVMGYLHMIAPSELMQALGATARSGILRAKSGQREIDLYLHDGRLHRITPGGESPNDPEECFYDFLGWTQGNFRFTPGERQEKRTFFKETTALLLEGMRRRDERRVVHSQDPSRNPGSLPDLAPAELHVAGSTVRPISPFSSLEVPLSTEPLPANVAGKWVHPFYMGFMSGNLAEDKVGSLRALRDQIDPVLITRLLAEFNWRPRLVGAWFAALGKHGEAETLIGRLLLRSDVCDAGKGYCLALARFNTGTARDYLHEYLTYYLTRTDLWFDQDAAMAAVAFLDRQNGTDALAGFLPAWRSFIADKKNWSLESSIAQFERRMSLLLRIEGA